MDTPEKDSRPQRWQRTLALIISPIALLLALWSLVHSHSLQHSLNSKTHALADLFQHRLPALETQVERHEQQLQVLSANFASDSARVQADVAQLIEQSQLTWETSGNPVQTARFLNLALGKLATHQDPTSQALRAALEADLQTLKTLGTLSPERLIATLEALITRISALPLTPGTYQPSTINAAQLPATHPWLTRLQGLVTVTKLPPLPDSSRTLHAREQLRQSLILKLSLAQWAVAQHQPPLYLQNLQAAHRLWQQLSIPAATGAPIEQQFLELLAAPLQPNLQLKSWEKHA